MFPNQFKALRAVAFLVFFIALVFFLGSQVITVAPRRVEVRNNSHQTIGIALIPYDNVSAGAFTFSILMLSCLQLWLVQRIGLTLTASEKLQRAEQNGTPNNPQLGSFKGSKP